MLKWAWRSNLLCGRKGLLHRGAGCWYHPAPCLFDKKPEKLRYDKEECRRKKERMRQIFDRVVEDGDSYRVLLATKDGQPRQQGLFGGSAASRPPRYRRQARWLPWS